ncbi:metallophosphoesterase family protein [Fredinandcohnia humi]
MEVIRVGRNGLMKELTFLHIADLHLDSPFSGLSNLPQAMFKRVQESTFTSFSRLITIAIEHEVDFVVISGDIFDSEDRSLRAQSRFRKEMERLLEYHIDAFVIHGNHDHVGGSWLHFEWPSNVHVFSSGEVEVKGFEKNGETLAHLYGFSYTKKAVEENKSRYYEKKEGASFHIGLLHGSVEGETTHSQYAPFLLSDLQQKGFDYWALGHIHVREVLTEDPPIIYPGNIQGRHKKESGEKGGYIVRLTSKGASYSFIPSADLIWENGTLDISQISTFNDLANKALTLLDSYRREEQGVFLTLEVIGTGPLYMSLQDKGMQEDLQSLLNDDVEGSNFVYVVQIKNNTQPEIDRDKLKKESHFISDLLEKLETYQDFDDALLPLRTHQAFRRYVVPFTDEELEEILAEAETLVLQNIYPSNRG